MGVDGIDESGVPLPNVLVDYLKEKGMLSNGVLPVLGNAVMQTGKTPNEIAELVGKGELDLATLPQGDMEKQKKLCNHSSINLWKELKLIENVEKTILKQ